MPESSSGLGFKLKMAAHNAFRRCTLVQIKITSGNGTLKTLGLPRDNTGCVQWI